MLWGIIDMRLGIDFDNTIICYDHIFSDLAKSWEFIPIDERISKQTLRDKLRLLADGELAWQRLQGKVYGELINLAEVFPGFKEFIAQCHAKKDIEVFIVSHKTEFGHFDENQVNLRDAARSWMRMQGFFEKGLYYIPERNVFFETTRAEKIKRIQSLQCTHFIDDLVEVLNSPLFPDTVERILFQPFSEERDLPMIKSYSSWEEIKTALFND